MTTETVDSDQQLRCFFFGCWNEAGHYLFLPGGNSVPRQFWHLDRYAAGTKHLDGTLAPRVNRSGVITCLANGGDMYRSEECPQGDFLLHGLDTGYTAMSWWDRCQGDLRPNCNSTVILEGNRTEAEMLSALAEHFPHVLANLTKAGVTLRRVQLGGIKDGSESPR